MSRILAKHNPVGKEIVMAWRPLPGWCIVSPVDAEDQIGSLFIPQQTVAEMTRTQYEVVAFGGSAFVDPTDDDPQTPVVVAPGDWVVIPQRVAFDVIEERLMLAPANHIWGVLTA